MAKHECTEDKCRCPAELPKMRPILDEWIEELAHFYYRAVDYERPFTRKQRELDLWARRAIAHVVGQTQLILDLVLPAWPDLSRLDVQGIGAAAFSISSKLHASESPAMRELARMTDGACSTEGLIRFELRIMNMLSWRIPNLLESAPVIDPDLDSRLIPPRPPSDESDLDWLDATPNPSDSEADSGDESSMAVEPTENWWKAVTAESEPDFTPPLTVRVDVRRWTKKKRFLYVI